MTEAEKRLEPGQAFYDVFLGGLRVFGSNLTEWAQAEGVDPTNAKSAAYGSWNGKKARLLRDRMVETIGRETFERLYRERVERQKGEAA